MNQEAGLSVGLGAIVPHPPIIIPEVGGARSRRVEATVRAMKRLSEVLAGASPDVLVFISPHSPVIADSVAVKVAGKLRGSLEMFGAPQVALEAEGDVELAEAICAAAQRRSVPVAKTEDRGDTRRSDILDHGLLVPLYFFREAGVATKIVSLSISCLGRTEHYTLGMAVEEAAASLGRRAVFVASGDLSHRLTPDAPAGYSPEGRVFDEAVVKLVCEGRISEVVELDHRMTEEAGECGLRSLITLAGVFDGRRYDTELLSYEGPFGVGYMVAMVTESAGIPPRDSPKG